LWSEIIEMKKVKDIIEFAYRYPAYETHNRITDHTLKWRINMGKKVLTAALVLILLSACAHQSKNIAPANIYYTDYSTSEGLTFAYQYNILSQTRNDRYAFKETQCPFKLIAVKITNRTARMLDVKNDLIILKNNTPVVPVSAYIFMENVKQNTAGYLAYLLLLPLTFNVASGHDVDSYPIGLIIAPLLAFGNMAVAIGSNKQIERTINDYNILTRSISGGETAYGLLCIESYNYEPLTVQLRER
jgi:hypothetical protein